MRHIVVLSFASLTLSLAACIPHAVTPSARPMPLSSAQAPTTGKQDIQIDGNGTGEFFGANILNGNVRYRRGVRDDLAITGDAGVIHVGGEKNDQNPFAGTARVGVQYHAPANDDLHAAAFAGAGGGYSPTAGGFASVDVGGVLTGTHRSVRPILVLDLYASEPIGAKTFMGQRDNVGTPDDQVNVKLPRTIGVQGLLGFELGARDGGFVIGLAAAQLHTFENDEQDAESQTFVGIGGGFRFDTN